MTARTLTATVRSDGSIVYDVPTMRDVPDSVTRDEAHAVMDAAIELAELTLIDNGAVPGESVTIGVLYTADEHKHQASNQ